MKRMVMPSLFKRVLASFLCLCLCLLSATGCQRDDLPRVADDAVIRDPIRTTAAGNTEDDFPLPNDYYFEGNYLQNKASVINDLLADSGDNAEAFIFITDPHTEQNRNAGQTPSLVHYLCTQTDLSRAIIGGDVYVGTAPAYAASMAEAFSDGTVHYTMGNHEYDRGTTDGMLAEVYDEGKTEQIGNADRHYYYVDSPDTKLRYIVLNGFEEGSVATTDIAAQNEWLKNEALDVEGGWGILVFAHQFVNREWYGSSHRYFGTAWKPIAKTLLEYDGAGEILAVFHGHIHQDMISRMKLDADGNPVLDDDCDGIPLIGTAADKYYTDKETAPYEMLIDRQVGTVTEQAFDVVIVDREAGQIHCVRIGAPARDGTGWLDEEQVEVRTVNIRDKAEQVLSPDYETISLPSNVGEWQDIVKVGNELWLCDESTDGHGELDGYIYRLNASDYSYIGKFVHNLGHLNSVDYDADNDRLITGSASNASTETPKIWIFENVLSWTKLADGAELVYANLEATEINLSSDISANSSYINACWGTKDDTGNQSIYINANLGHHWLKIYPTIENGKYTGAYTVDWEKTYTRQSIPNNTQPQVIQGMDWYNGSVITGLTHTPITCGVWHFDTGKTVSRTIIQMDWDTTGAMEGLAVIDGYIYCGISQTRTLCKFKI